MKAYTLRLLVKSMGKVLYENKNMMDSDDYDEVAAERQRLIKDEWKNISKKIEEDTGVEADKQIGMFFIDRG